jgi:protein phosphatase
MNCPKHAAATDQGRVRANNEDAFFQSPESGIFLVSDGMGGENAGEVASRIVAEILPSVLARELAGMDDPRASPS